VVYKGKFENRDVAVKTIIGSMFDEKQIANEIKIMRSFDPHVNILRYLGTQKVGSKILIALELCDMNLKQWVENKESGIEPLEILKQITLGLVWIHSHKILHRDIKPENVLIFRQENRIKISDFGLSKRVLPGNSLDATTIAGGTVGWVAPEVVSVNLDGKQFTYVSSKNFDVMCNFK